MEIEKLNEKYLRKLNVYRKKLYKEPTLRQLFFELTLRCNEKCWHCGSRCNDVCSEELDIETWKAIVDQVKEDFEGKLPQINITGGEPLLYSGFEEFMEYVHSSGFRWGMTSNALNITPEIAEMLERTGMATISVSIDGVESTHDRLRGVRGAYKRTMKGIQNLIDRQCFEHIMVTTVVNHETLAELDELYEIMCGLDIDSWRIIGVEPIGRALDRPELAMTDEDQSRLFEFIESKRREDMPVTYGCSHFLGLKRELSVRNFYFLCQAGVKTASIMSNGDVGACLDIERNHITVQGNIKERRFSEIWKNEFKAFRYDRSEADEKCRACGNREYCGGGACHTWDFEAKKQRVCIADI